jgi:hypothetical protein
MQISAAIFFEQSDGTGRNCSPHPPAGAVPRFFSGMADAPFLFGEGAKCDPLRELGPAQSVDGLMPYSRTVIPGKPFSRPRQKFGCMPLQLHQVIERVHTVQPAGLNWAHEHRRPRLRGSSDSIGRFSGDGRLSLKPFQPTAAPPSVVPVGCGLQFAPNGIRAFPLTTQEYICPA